MSTRPANPHPLFPMEARIAEWNAEQGYGFAMREGTRWFLHIRSFASRDFVPAKGDRVRFVPGVDPRGRPCAAEAVLIHRKFRVAAESGSFQWLLLLLPVLALLQLPVAIWITGGTVLCLSLLTFSLYSRDKRAALSGKSRVPESILHFLELAGGWPGALFAQRHLRHKSSKPAYQRAFWLVVLSHQMLAFDLLLISAGILDPAWSGGLLASR